MPEFWYPTSNPVPVEGGWAWEDWVDSPYPTQVFNLFKIRGFQRVHLGVQTQWYGVPRRIEDVTILVPSFDATDPPHYNQVLLLDYPLDELPEGETGDFFEIWTGPGQTGTKFTLVGNDQITLAPTEYQVDFPTGMIRFSNSAETALLYVSYWIAQGAVRPAYFNYMGDNLEAITDALLNGFVHGLISLIDLDQPGTHIAFDFSQMSGSPGVSDWFLFMGDGGGALNRDMGWNTLGQINAVNVMPGSDSFGELGSISSAAKWTSGAIKDLQILTQARLNNIIQATTGQDILIDLAGSGDNVVIRGGSNPTNHGTVTIDEYGGIDVVMATAAPTGNHAIQAQGWAISDDGTMKTEGSANKTSLGFGTLKGDFTEGKGSDDSNAVNADGWAWCESRLIEFIGSRWELQTLFLEAETTVSGDYIDTITIKQRNPDSTTPQTLHAEAVTWGQGTTGHARYQFTFPADVKPVRPFFVEVSCTNGTANSIKISAIWVEAHLAA